MRENRPSGSEGGVEPKTPSLPLSTGTVALLNPKREVAYGKFMGSFFKSLFTDKLLMRTLRWVPASNSDLRH